MVAESQGFINDSEDYTIYYPCGCRVVFLGSCFHRSSRMEACASHDKQYQGEARNRIVWMAKEELRMKKLLQPPK